MSTRRAVLIVDDDPFIRKLIVTTLEGVAEFELHEASDGEEAVQAAAVRAPRLVFLDIDMPRMDGIEAARRIREQRDTPIIFITAHGDQETRAHIANMVPGAPVLAKPISAHRLRDAIALVLR